MLSADVAAERLSTSEQLIALLALELIGGEVLLCFLKIEVAFHLSCTVSGLWRGKERSRGLGSGLLVVGLWIELQSNLGAGILGVFVEHLLITLFSDTDCLFLASLFHFAIIIFMLVV